MTETAVGASTCASGSQVWNGKAGILIAKPMKSAVQRTSCTFMGTCAVWLSRVMSKECGSDAKYR